MFSIRDERRVALGDVPNVVGPVRGGKKLHKGTPYRWARVGVRAADGSRIFLETQRIAGAGTITSVEAIERFLAQLNAHGEGASRDNAGASAPNATRPVARDAQRAREVDECRARGI